jgi:hypothetical protein
VLKIIFRFWEENLQDQTGPSQQLFSWSQRDLAGFWEVGVFEVFLTKATPNFATFEP